MWVLSVKVGSREIGLVHKTSMAVILLSLAYFLAGLAAAGTGRVALHIYIMAGGMLGAFVVA
jgi:hypothetical protein